MSKPLTREEILGCQDFKIELVHTPEWGGDVYVRSMTSEARDRMEIEAWNSIRDKDGKRKAMDMPKPVKATMAARTICDAQGNLMFTEADIEALAKKSAAALERVCDVAKRLSLISDADLKEIEGN